MPGHRPSVHIQPDERMLVSHCGLPHGGSMDRRKTAQQPTTNGERGLSLLNTV